MRDLATVRRRIFFVILRRVFMLFLCLFLVSGVEIVPHGKNFISQNKALACAPCGCINTNHAITRGVVTFEHGVGTFLTDPEALASVPENICVPGIGTRGWISFEFCRHREEFIVFYWFKEHILAAMMMMTEQLVSTAMEQMFIIGTFFDAEIQLETQRLFQELTAQAHKDYHPSFGMCEIGTLSRSLAASQRQGEYNSYLLSQHMQDRQMRSIGMAGAAGKGMDVVHRWEQFRETFCNEYGNDQELGPRTNEVICQGVNIVDRDKDVDYTRMVEYPNTIAVNFADGADDIEEESIFALASNLYGHNVFSYFPETFFKNPDNQDEYMYVRSIVAKRSVAQNSFNNIIALKSEGKEETEELRLYMEKVLEQLGIEDPAEALAILGERPSYYAQMELLTKKLYQRPEFYTSLYDKPVNVERKKAALRALGLVQNMDLFKSKLRSEAALSVLTEMEVYKAQEMVQDRMNEARATGIQ